MALTRRESVKLLGASLLASGVTAASAKPADARSPRHTGDKTPARPPVPPTTASMKRLYALPILLDY
jgi:hypothetical protein